MAPHCSQFPFQSLQGPGDPAHYSALVLCSDLRTRDSSRTDGLQFLGYHVLSRARPLSVLFLPSVLLFPSCVHSYTSFGLSGGVLFAGEAPGLPHLQVLRLPHLFPLVKFTTVHRALDRCLFAPPGIKLHESEKLARAAAQPCSNTARCSVWQKYLTHTCAANE